MKRSELNIIHSAFFLLISIGNLADCIISKAPLWEYFTHVVVILLVSVAIFISKDRISMKLMAWIFVLFSLLSLILAEHDSLTGAIFLCFAIYALETRNLAMISVILTAIGILVRAVIGSFSVPQTINYIAGYAYIIAVFYWLIIRKHHPSSTGKPTNYEDVEIMRLVVDGLSYKEIAYRMDLSTRSISRRLEHFRAKEGANSNEHLAIILSQTGQIVLRYDRTTKG